jgi:ABC-type glutathione transport system ATPase component
MLRVAFELTIRPLDKASDEIENRMAKLRSENISIEYLNERTKKSLIAIESMSFEVEEGQFIAMLQP